MKRRSDPAYRPLKAGRKLIAEAGRFITKCEMVCGMVMIFEKGAGVDVGLVRERRIALAGRTALFLPDAVSAKRLSAVFLINV